jgi:DeoR/GlpR family transcriptional regulator of sugar metabolism
MGNLQRESEILQILREEKYATVENLSHIIHISPSSIRRDLTHLESQGLIQRDHGGASILPYIPGMAPFLSRVHEDKKGKLSIIRAAADLIKPHSTLYVDSSTMAMEIYQYVSSDMNLTVFTNNTLLAHLLAEKKIKTYCIGGYISKRNDVITIGTYALEMLKNIYVDYMFFSSSAITEDGIISDLDEDETAIRKFMLSHAKTKIFLCHHNRFGKNAPFGLTDVHSLDYIFSDFDFPEYFWKQYTDVAFIKAAL